MFKNRGEKNGVCPIDTAFITTYSSLLSSTLLPTCLPPLFITLTYPFYSCRSEFPSYKRSLLFEDLFLSEWIKSSWFEHFSISDSLFLKATGALSFFVLIYWGLTSYGAIFTSISSFLFFGERLSSLEFKFSENFAFTKLRDFLSLAYGSWL